MSEQNAIAIQRIQKLRAEERKALAGFWVTTVQELLAKAASPGGVEGLSEMLHVSNDRIQEILTEARSLLPKESVDESEVPPAIDRGMGLLLDEDSRKKQVDK
jgi:hypothetical protein